MVPRTSSGLAMIKTSGFRSFRPRNLWGNRPRPFIPATLFRTATGFERVVYSVREYGWADHFRATDRIRNAVFRRIQNEWRTSLFK